MVRSGPCVITEPHLNNDPLKRQERRRVSVLPDHFELFSIMFQLPAYITTAFLVAEAGFNTPQPPMRKKRGNLDLEAPARPFDYWTAEAGSHCSR